MAKRIVRLCSWLFHSAREHTAYVTVVNDTENVIMDFTVNYSLDIPICISQIPLDTAFLREVLPGVIIVYRGYAVYAV